MTPKAELTARLAKAVQASDAKVYVGREQLMQLVRDAHTYLKGKKK